MDDRAESMLAGELDRDGADDDDEGLPVLPPPLYCPGCEVDDSKRDEAKVGCLRRGYGRERRPAPPLGWVEYKSSAEH